MASGNCFNILVRHVLILGSSAMHGFVCVMPNSWRTCQRRLRLLRIEPIGSLFNFLINFQINISLELFIKTIVSLDREIIQCPYATEGL